MTDKLNITVGKSRMDVSWRVTGTTWEALLGRLSKTHRTRETVAEWKAMSPTTRGKLKDVGGFVGGTVGTKAPDGSWTPGPRRAPLVVDRCLVTLDVDYGVAGLPGKVAAELEGIAWAMYTTHSHAPEAPRWRLIVPLSRAISPEEYAPVARRVAQRIGMDLFDDSTYQPERLMYWPSTSSDGEYLLEHGEGAALDPDEVLATYVDWHDAREWPLSSRVTSLVTKSGRKLDDPASKGGVVGAFCACYGIEEAIDTFLPDTYERTASPDRWTYLGGSTTGGAIVYEDKWLYSHHGTDPCCEREVNAFDLVRLHLFADLDAGADADTPVNRLPSYQRMAEVAGKDSRVSAELTRRRIQEMGLEFAGAMEGSGDGDGEDPAAWLAQLQWHDEKRRDYHLPSPYNFGLIVRNDPAIRDAVRYNAFTDTPELVRELPWQKDLVNHKDWTDTDDNGLAEYVSEHYRLVGKGALIDAHDLDNVKHSYHPVRDYLATLQWDGVPRVETLLCDYLGAADTPLVRAMTRKHLAAAVARVMRPGVKYDYVLALTGPEGIGKSTLIAKLGRGWYNDSFSSSDMGSKESMEQLRGCWLIEMGELKDYKKATVESFKAFVSKTADEYRPAYGRKKVRYLRQCVFFATTNERAFLKGDTGNRRFWTVDVGEDLAPKDVFALDEATVGQIWAEALDIYNKGERLYLPADLEKQAREEQAAHNEITADDRTGLIEAYLRTPLPAGWYNLTKAQRSDYFDANTEPLEGDSMRRQFVCSAEVLTECFHKRDITRYDTKEINQILANMPGLVFRGAIKTSDMVYGSQRRYMIRDEFYDEK